MTEQLARLENNSNTSGTKRRAPSSSSSSASQSARGRSTRSSAESTAGATQVTAGATQVSSQGSTQLAIVTTAPDPPEEIDLKPFLKSAVRCQQILGFLCHEVGLHSLKAFLWDRARCEYRSIQNLTRRSSACSVARCR
jgi:hypothetical protein